jgi:hypothetical protein
MDLEIAGIQNIIIIYAKIIKMKSTIFKKPLKVYVCNFKKKMLSMKIKFIIFNKYRKIYVLSLRLK